ncbi:MAG: tetratricopeptide repeat protein [Alphaproteobacteria bacterium]|nr:tetratricopeptide repeat protein [Alphaproteobacteria bacterium]
MTEPDAAFDAAATHYREGRAEQAEAACRDILDRTPHHARALHLLGIIEAAQGRGTAGLALIRRALAAKPDYAEAHFNLAAMLAAAAQHAEAAAHYAEAGRLRPDDVVAQIRHGAMLGAAGQADDAIRQYRNVLVRWPDCLPVLLELSAQLLMRGDAAGALEVARRACRLAPDSAAAATRLGRALKQAGHIDEALAEYRRALALDPGHLEALNFLASGLYEQGALGEAETVATHALKLAPTDPTSHFNAGIIAQSVGDLPSATASIRRALELAPGDPLYRRAYLANALYDPQLDESARRSIHREFGERITRAVGAQPLPESDPDPRRRIRVGWLSSDLRDHPVALNIEPILSGYDRSAFEMFLYGEVLKPDHKTLQLRSLTDHWHSTVGQSDREVAERIRTDRIDILIILAARFDRNRPEVAAWRAAPIQVSFHDPATSGVPAIDYLIADRLLAPRGGEEWFAERILALPTFYLRTPIELSPASGPPPLTRGEGVTFGSFNHPAKVNDSVLQLWARLLYEVEGSRLMLKYRSYYSEAPLRARVRRAAIDAGVDPERFVLAGEREAREVHLARYRHIDIALDPFPFSGSTTTFEALWMGVPVVTLAGKNMASRWSAAMLGALKLDSWVADSASAYVRIASDLARDAAQLADLRSGLRERVIQSPLCDTRRGTRQLERLLKAMWRHWYATRTA